MMGQSQNQRGSSTSISRLSASAKPFTMNHLANLQPISTSSSFAPPAFDPSLHNLQPIASSLSGLESFSLLNLEQDNLTVRAYHHHGYHSALPFDHLWGVGPEPYNPQYPSEGIQTHSDFDVGSSSLTISKISKPIHAPNQLSIGVGEWGKGLDSQGSFCRIKENDDGLIPRETLLKQGKASVAGELKSCDEASDGLHGKCSNLTEKHNQTTYWGTEQIDVTCISLPMNELTPSKFSASYDLHSASRLQDVYGSQVSYREPVANWSSLTLGGASSKGSYSHIDSYSVKTTVSHSEGKSYLPSLVFGSSGTTAISSPSSHLFSENFNCGVHTAVNKNKNSPDHYKPASTKDVCFIQSAESKGVGNHESLVGKDRISDKPKSNEPLSTLKVAKPSPQISSPDDINLKHLGAEMCEFVDTSKSLDINIIDLDLDSPCWKGTKNSTRSPFEVSRPVNSHVGDEVEAHNCLNPMAPHFFPCYRKSSVCLTSFIENDSASFQKSPTSVENLLSGEHELIDSVKMGSCSRETEMSSSGIRTQCSDDILESNAENELAINSNFGSVLNSSHTGQPYFVENYFTSNDKVARGKAVASSLKGNNKGANEVSTFVSFAGDECVPSSSFSGVGVPTKIIKTFQDLASALYRSSGIDGHILVNAMSDLSELLVQNFSNLDSLDELDRDAIQHIINNLYACVRNRDGQRSNLLPEPTHPGISYCLEKSTDLQKLSNMEVEVTRTKATTVSHGQADEKCGPGRKNFYTTASREFLQSGSEFSVEEGDRMTQLQAMKKTLKDDPFTEEMHPQALLYRKLWLEAEAAVCAMKYKAHVFHMKTEMGFGKI